MPHDERSETECYAIEATPFAVPGTTLVPVSLGELVDKITILEIKSERIDDVEKGANVRQELRLLDMALSRFVDVPPQMGELKVELRAINEALWETEDEIRNCERKKDFGGAFVRLARNVYLTNDRRSAIKRRLNQLAGSAIVEEKSYASQGVHSRAAKIGDHQSEHSLCRECSS